MRGILFLVLLSVLLSNCSTVFFPNVMFKTKEDEITTAIDSTLTLPEQYMINKGDRILLQVFSNDGYEIVSVISSNVAQRQNTSEIEFLVKGNGYVRLPLIDSIKLEGYTIEGAEKLLQEKYGEYFNEPFVILTVTNRRVFVYMGRSTARVIPLQNENMTLLEVLAEIGGLTDENKSRSIKLIRGDLNEPEVRIIDLSTIEGMKQADLVVRANDVIYVEPTLKITSGLLSELSPIISLLSSAVLFYSVFVTTAP